MKNILQYLLEKSNYDSIIKPDEYELYFSMLNYRIYIKLSSLHTIHIDESNNKKIYSINEIDSNTIRNLDINNIESVYIKSGIPTHCNIKKAYTYIATDIYKNINTHFHNAFESYKIDTYRISSECCSIDDALEYGIIFTINKDYWRNLDFHKYIHDVFKNSFSYTIPEYYFVRNNYKDTLVIKMLISNTKIRRIGYLKILLQMLSENKSLSTYKMYNNFEKYCLKYKDQLHSYSNTKGEVVLTKTGASAKPYMELAEHIGLIHHNNEICRIGKTGKVLSAIYNSIKYNSNNIFNLTLFDQIFFLENLLRNDYIHLYVIIELLFISPKITFSTFKKEYQNKILEYVNDSIIQNSEHNSMKIVPIKIIKRRISEWKQTATYIEHIIMPRLNWMYDLGLITMQNSTYSLTNKGEKLYFHLSVWSDLIMRKIISPDYFLDNFYMQIVNDIWELNNKIYDERYSYIFKEYLDNSFELFKTLAPNRVTFSLMCNYTKYMLFLNNSIIIETELIKDIFLKSSYPGYIYKYQEQFKDGYIQKIK